MEKWCNVQPSMMSDEELEETNGKFKVCRQYWRSTEFNELMDELDARAISSQDKARPRMARYFGTPCKVGPSPAVSHWMISTHPESSDKIYLHLIPQIYLMTKHLYRFIST